MESPYSRLIFTDQWNSFWHFILGILATLWIDCISPFFLYYQYIQKYDYNSTIDTIEYAIGYVLSYYIQARFFQ